MTTPRRVPAGLGPKAGALWRGIVKDYDLDEHEYFVLESACRELNLLDRLERKLKGAPLTVPGSRGQDVVNPLLQELRQHRAAFAALLKALKLPGEATPRPSSARSLHGQAAANARWMRRD